MNKHGLARDIPEAIKREVRQRDGFGCVVCGNAIIDYEHLNPEFSDATEHKAEGIVLLCLACHGKKTRGLLSKATVSDCSKAPAARRSGFSFGAFDVGTEHPTIVMGNITVTNTALLLRIYAESVLRVDPPEQAGGPFRLSASIYDRNATQILRIVENEWQTPSANWDVELVGRRITIRSASRNIDLVLRSDPPNKLIIERLHMNYRDIEVSCSEGATTRIRSNSEILIDTASMEFDGCECAIQVDEKSCMMGMGGSMYVGRASFGNPLTASPLARGPQANSRAVDLERYLALHKRIDDLVAARVDARNAKNFAEADRIRKELAAEGVEIMDGPQGSTWRRV